MPPDNVELIGILIAALGGLAVGLERQWSGHASGSHARFAGARTFTLLGLLSGLSGTLWIRGFGAISLVLMIAAAALVLIAYAAIARSDIEATTEAAGLVVVGAGAAAGAGNWALAGGLVAITTLLLVEKSSIHDLARRLDGPALQAAVRFGVMAVVILPLLPEGPYGPWGGVRPRALWIAVLMFSGLSFAAYVARLVVKGAGYPLTGVLGGLISSTAVAFSFSRLSRSEPSQSVGIASGVVAASTILFLRVLATTSVFNPELARSVAVYFALPFAAGTVLSCLGLRRKEAARGASKESKNPLQLWTSLQMALLFQAVLYAVYWLDRTWGPQGLLLSGAVLGLTDVDALTLSMARSTLNTDLKVVAQALSIGVLSNTALKTIVVLALGHGTYRWLAAAGLAAIGGALAAAIVLF